jgi:hypothetical protein
VTSHGRDDVVLLSAEEYQRLRSLDRRAMHVCSSTKAPARPGEHATTGGGTRSDAHASARANRGRRARPAVGAQAEFVKTPETVTMTRPGCRW